MATEVIAGRALSRTEPPWRKRFRVLWKERHRSNFANFVDRLVGLYGGRTAFVLDAPIEYPGFSGDTLSYGDVGRLVNRFGGAMRALGVRKGDRVGLITMNRIEMAFVNFGLARIGSSYAPRHAGPDGAGDSARGSQAIEHPENHRLLPSPSALAPVFADP